MNSEQVAYY